MIKTADKNPFPTLLYQDTQPTPSPDPSWVIFNDELCTDLGIEIPKEDLLLILAGNRSWPEMRCSSYAYSGHQFGHFSPTLGDGRAHCIAQIKDKNGDAWDVQLKGSGRTPFSRQGDGRSALGPAIREYIVSESMAALKVPTTRTLAVLRTGETVKRDKGTPGGISVRLTKSHVRIGSFEYCASQKDLPALRQLADYMITRYYPECVASDNPYLDFFKALCQKQARLVSQWMGLGFIHGVMNTDNVSIIGETIDYGPCAFMDQFKRDKVYSYIDQMGRYAYSNQPAIMQWNLARLAESMLPLFDQSMDVGINLIRPVIETLPDVYEKEWTSTMSHKLGLDPNDEKSPVVINQFLDHLESEKLDFTTHFLKEQPDANPIYIPRNHLVEHCIRQAEDHQNDQPIHDLMGVLKTPFIKQEGQDHYTQPPKSEEEVHTTFCGT